MSNYKEVIKYSRKPWHEVNPDRNILGFDNDVQGKLFKMVVFVLIRAEEDEGYRYFKTPSAIFWCDVINQNPDYIYKKIKKYKERLSDKKRFNKNSLL